MEEEDIYQPIAYAAWTFGNRIHLFAAVDSIPVRNPTDSSHTMRIVDESYPAGISLIFWDDDIHHHLRSRGDVISLRNVVVTGDRRHRELESLVVAFNEKYSSFALFEGKESTECSPYFRSMKYYGRQCDNAKLTKMRTWLLNRPLGTPTRTTSVTTPAEEEAAAVGQNNNGGPRQSTRPRKPNPLYPASDWAT